MEAQFQARQSHHCATDPSSSPFSNACLLSDYLTDSDLAPLPDIMMRMHELSPTSLDWPANWRSPLGVVCAIGAGLSAETKED
jgi:hypothetical protein